MKTSQWLTLGEIPKQVQGERHVRFLEAGKNILRVGSKIDIGE